jgi:hypothetical protein
MQGVAKSAAATSATINIPAVTSVTERICKATLGIRGPMTNPRQIGKHVYGVRHCVIKSE